MVCRGPDVCSSKKAHKLVKQSIQVRRYEYPLEGSRCPMRSMWTWSKLVSGLAKVPRGVTVC